MGKDQNGRRQCQGERSGNGLKGFFFSFFFCSHRRNTNNDAGLHGSNRLFPFHCCQHLCQGYIKQPFTKRMTHRPVPETGKQDDTSHQGGSASGVKSYPKKRPPPATRLSNHLTSFNPDSGLFGCFVPDQPVFALVGKPFLLPFPLPGFFYLLALPQTLQVEVVLTHPLNRPLPLVKLGPVRRPECTIGHE